MINTTTYALKQLFYSLGGNAEDVAGINDDLVIIAKISALNLGSSSGGGVSQEEFDALKKQVEDMGKELAGKLTESDTGTEEVESGLEARNKNGVVTLNFVSPFTAPTGNADTVTVIPDVELPERFCPADPVRFPISIDGQYAEIFITDDGVISTRAAFATTTSMPLRGTVVYSVWEPLM